MVKSIITILFVHLLSVCLGQVINLDNKIELNASFSSDSLFMGDSLKLNLHFRNNTNNNFSLYPKAIIGLVHNHKEFITYDKPERIVYKLNDICDYDGVVVLKPGERFEYRYSIKVDNNFFYKGENDILIFYHLYDKPLKKKKKKVNKREPILSLWSPIVKIKVL